MKLSDVAFSDLRIGDKVISAIGNHGTITGLLPREETIRKEDNEILIEWENGSVSHNWHFWMDKVQYVGQ